MRIEIGDGIHVTLREERVIYLLDQAHIGAVVSDERGEFVRGDLARDRLTETQYADGMEVLRSVADRLGIPFHEGASNLTP